ncbi:MAG: aminopeptidase P family protein [Silicimonas sp.]|nr:aminopeptidase P family protein [Silicimonas sp.]
MKVQRAAPDIKPSVNLDEMRAYRLDRLRQELSRRDIAAALLFDPVNIRYAVDCTNMQVWTLHNPARYVFVAASGPVILWEIHGAEHLARDLPLITDIRVGTPWFHFAAGDQSVAKAKEFAAEIADEIRLHGGGNRRIAVDRVDTTGTFSLLAEGLTIEDGMALAEAARVIKSADEIAAMRIAVAACEEGVRRMRAALRPGITENALWSLLHQANIELGGEWIMTRLLASGQRTNPWYQECGAKILEEGEIVSFDTDLVGPFGYVCDISRAWICGETRPEDRQRELLSVSKDQIEHNRALLRPGVSTVEISEKSFRMPEKFVPQEYLGLIHGVGLGDEHPVAVPAKFAHRGVKNTVLQPGMTVSIESYVGEVGGLEGVKLEEQVLITEAGSEALSTYPTDETWT